MKFRKVSVGHVRKYETVICRRNVQCSTYRYTNFRIKGIQKSISMYLLYGLNVGNMKDALLYILYSNVYRTVASASPDPDMNILLNNAASATVSPSPYKPIHTVLKLNTNAADWSSTKNMIEHRAARVHPLCLFHGVRFQRGSNSALTWALCRGVHNVLVWQRFSFCSDNKLTACESCC